MSDANPFPAMLEATRVLRARRLAHVFRSTSTPRARPAALGSVAGARSPGVRDRGAGHKPPPAPDAWLRDAARR